MSIVTGQLLAEIPLFAKMSDRAREDLRSIMTEQVFQPGQMIMHAGEGGGSFYIIEQGNVEVWLTDTEGEKLVLDTLGPGKFFGELAMLSGETRSASVTSQEQVITLELDRDEFFAFLRQRPDVTLDILAELGNRLKHSDDLLRTRVSRNANKEHEQQLSAGQRVADVIADFSGSIAFLFLNLFAFVGWIVANTIGPLFWHFDPYPFQFLTMAVSLEAIFLSIFVLISQNRQAAKDRIKADLDYQVNVKAELEMSEMSVQMREIQGKLHHLHVDLLEFKELTLYDPKDRV